MNRPDVVQFLSSLPASAGSCLKVLREIGIPSVFAYTLPGKRPSNPLKRMLRKISFRGLCHKLDCIITASTATKDLLLQMGIRSRIEVIPNGVDLTRFRPVRNTSERFDIRQQLGIDFNSQVILSIGAIHPRKGTDLLLEAWVSLASRFPNLHLYLTGMRHDLNAPELTNFRKRLESLVCESNASDRVHFMGYTKDVEDYLRASDLLVFPSHREGMPNAVLEAMASGLPCVLTPFIGLSSDFGKPDREYLLASHDSKAIVNAVASVLENCDLQDRLKTNGRKWVECKMDIEDALDRYAGVYRSLAADRKPI
jgi:glycosyltransferase involved in cell wall biosynthesis